MPRWTLNIDEQVTYHAVVEAPTLEAAREMADEMVRTGDGYIEAPITVHERQCDSIVAEADDIDETPR